MIKYLIFDLGGVIFDSGTSKAIQSISEKYNISQKQVAEFLTESSQAGTKYRTGEITREEFWTQAIASWGKTLDPVVLNNIWVSGYSLRQEMIPILSGLKKNGYILGILSNTVSDRFDYIKKQLALDEYFSGMVLSFSDQILKPQKQAFLLILKKLEVENPKEALYIDDKEIHAEVARSLGMKAIVYKNVSQLVSELQSLRVRINGKKKFDSMVFGNTLRRVAGIFTAKNHPEWRTKNDVIKWVEKNRKESDRTF